MSLVTNALEGVYTHRDGKVICISNSFCYYYLQQKHFVTVTDYLENKVPHSTKLWRIWRILSDLPKFYSAKNAFRKFYKSAITVYKY